LQKYEQKSNLTNIVKLETRIELNKIGNKCKIRIKNWTE